MSELARVEIVDAGDARVAAIGGEIDASNAEDVAKTLDRAAEDWLGRLVIDLTETAYIDSVGLSVIFSLAERMRARRRELFVIVPEDAVIRRVLLMVDLPGLASMYSSLADMPPPGA